MTRRIARVAFVAAIASLAGSLLRGQATPPVSPQTFRTSTDVVMVDVSVKRGNTPVAGLTAADFQLRDNAVVQRIETVEATVVPIDVTLVVDVSGWARSRVSRARQPDRAVAQLNAEVSRIAATLRPIDRMRVLAGDSYVQQVIPLSPVQSLPPVRAMVSGGLSSNYDAILAAVLQPVDPDRRHVVIASVKVFDSMSAVEAATVRDVASQSDALLHIVLMQIASAEDATAENFQCDQQAICEPVARSWAPALRIIINPLETKGADGTVRVPQLTVDGLALQAGAEATGGALHQGILMSAPTLAGTLAKAFEDLRTSYVLRYTPQGVKREGWHAITVTAPSARGAKVRARNGYAIETPADATAAAPASTPPPDSGRAAAAIPTPRTVNDFIAASERGDSAAIRAGLRGAGDPRRLFGDIVAAGNPWPGAMNREAAYVLELADAGVTVPGMLGQPVLSRDIDRLLDRYTRLVRHPIEPDAFERTWLWAAICLTEGRFSLINAKAMVDRALSRFPSDPQFLLASAIVTDQSWRTHGTVGFSGLLASRDQTTEAHVTAVVGKYRAASAFAETRTEAYVRLGWFLHRIGRHAEALATLDAVPPAAQDPAMNYLRLLFKGHTLLAMDRLDEAIAAYREAVAVVPGAQSARIALMGALTARGDSEAARAIGQQVETAASAGDPWWNYWLGDARWYAQALAAVRASNPTRAFAK